MTGAGGASQGGTSQGGASQGGTSRRAVMARKRQSRRPSRLGSAAGVAAKPDYVVEEDAGFPRLLRETWEQAAAAPDLQAAAQVLLTLGGHVPADVQLRALRVADECALKALCGISWREEEAALFEGAEGGGEPGRSGEAGVAGEAPAFWGELGLTTSGRIVLRAPSQGPLAKEEELVGAVLRVPWPARALVDYRSEVSRAAARFSRSVADCRQWLAAGGTHSRDEMLEELKEAALRTAPFVLYQEGKQYTNFRDRNTVTGKTLWPGHPDCALSSLQGMPLDLWSDNDVVMVVCLTLLVRSAGYARIEEANGTQLTVDHIAYMLERVRRNYNAVGAGQKVAPAASTRAAELDTLAVALRRRREEVRASVQLYREIHGALMHKIERVAGVRGPQARRREGALCAALRGSLGLAGGTLEELGDALEAAPSWLAAPHGGFGTGLESLVHATVSGANAAFETDFAMSRGMRSLPRLVAALREQDWSAITRWDITEYFCCVVPVPAARRYFADSTEYLADTAWAISSRMQYNSWHFVPGGLPRGPAVVARDFFVPPTLPDVAFYSDQHHRGHVASRVRFSIRSPQPVRVLDRVFNGFIDLRLLRCEGAPFTEADLLAAHRASAFIARATGLAAQLVAGGQELEVTSFDSKWHWDAVKEASQAAFASEALRAR
ncbi:hypothetical protein LHJ74_00545 [Streptomyces sp. N2-109]|uniref:Uncharacterized protein n=1 Tax=Streptomyces gossypii TaxID=2883101 RepID=A0ABT2JL55_9ACTN|nr:hypothetical protein [Streptomyces gossypii]MCT2588446.1 hypothetical protein [Streptomyces gossypii]